jgi:uncharacterized membrane protein
MISEVLTDSSTEANQTLPTMESLTRVVQRSRATSSGSTPHVEAKTSEDFVLPPTCTSTRRDEPFVLFDGLTDHNVRVLTFATARNLLILAKLPNWIADGTFYVAPKIFSQSYTTHAVIDCKCLPLIYVLTGDKKGDTYEYILNVIKFYFDQNCLVDTGTVMIYFEKAVMNAFQKSLPGWDISNCFLHLIQAVQKNIQKKFKALYFSDKMFARAARLVVFLSFVPVSDVETK